MGIERFNFRTHILEGDRYVEVRWNDVYQPAGIDIQTQNLLRIIHSKLNFENRTKMEELCNMSRTWFFHIVNEGWKLVRTPGESSSTPH